MIYTLSNQELETRETLKDLLADAINHAQLVRHQTTLTKDQREAVQWAVVAMLQARRALATEPRPMALEQLCAAMEG